MGKFYGITKGNKHSYNDFGLKIVSRELNPPSKNKVKSTVPFLNGSYDFSSLYGENTYGERKIKYVFDLGYNSKPAYISKQTAISEWLNDGFREPLYDDLIPGYYFIAECEDSIDFSEEYIDSEVTVTFNAYPFKIATMQDGHDIWDEFNFELDMVQETKFTVNGTQTIKLYNNGSIGIIPTIICSDAMQITKGNTTYEFTQGTSKSIFKLDKGLNELTITGNGTIEFKWYKELL